MYDVNRADSDQQQQLQWNHDVDEMMGKYTNIKMEEYHDGL